MPGGVRSSRRVGGVEGEADPRAAAARACERAPVGEQAEQAGARAVGDRLGVVGEAMVLDGELERIGRACDLDLDRAAAGNSMCR